MPNSKETHQQRWRRRHRIRLNREDRNRRRRDLKFRNRQRRLRREHYARHRIRILRKGKRWRREHPRLNRKYALKYFYGLTPKQVAVIRRRQKNRCGICQRRRKFTVDHNHRTGAIRGLLCRPCNLAIGVFRDDFKILLRAARWLQRAEAK